MVSIELQRTHMSFDGLCDVLGALGAELVPREIEGRQRPVGLDGIGKGDNTKREHDFLLSGFHILSE